MKKSKIYVGNLSYNTTEDGLRNFFGQFGTVEEVVIISDRQTGRSKGFGFVTFSSDEEGESALEANGDDLDGRSLKVSTAKENTNRRPGGNRQFNHRD